MHKLRKISMLMALNIMPLMANTEQFEYMFLRTTEEEIENKIESFSDDVLDKVIDIDSGRRFLYTFINAVKKYTNTDINIEDYAVFTLQNLFNRHPLMAPHPYMLFNTACLINDEWYALNEDVVLSLTGAILFICGKIYTDVYCASEVFSAEENLGRSLMDLGEMQFLNVNYTPPRRLVATETDSNVSQ